MITIISNKINTIDQISYKNLINDININQISCSCGHSGTLIKHAYYSRTIKIAGGVKINISILRVKCSICGKTHAILPDDIVPYSQISLNDHILIINNYVENTSQLEVMDNNPLIDESTISNIIRNYNKYWQQRLKALSICIKLTARELTRICFQSYNRQFMQIKCTTNILYHPPT